jgi:hypothetical protein
VKGIPGFFQVPVIFRTLLWSQEADWITGQFIAVDGGASLMDSSLPLDIQQAVFKHEIRGKHRVSDSFKNL